MRCRLKQRWHAQKWFPLRNRNALSPPKVTLRFEQLEPRMLLSTTPLISEFMASNNSTLDDGDGNSSDWIEIYNPIEAEPIDLAGWHLTDDANNLNKWTFPDLPQSELAAGEYLVVFASGQATETYIDPAGNLHTDFKLSAGGEYLGLVMPNGVTVAHQYSPFFPEQQTDISFGVPSSSTVTEVFVSQGANTTILVPTQGSLGTSWTGGEAFDDSVWQSGAVGVGFEASAQASTHLLNASNNNSLSGNDVYQLQTDSLTNGQLVNIDRTHTFANLPAELQGLDYVQTANDDKVAGPGFSVDISFDAGSTLYLSIDSRVGDNDPNDGPSLGSGTMDWVLNQGWADTGLTWNKENESATLYHVYSLSPPGTTHTFFAQDDTANRNMYSIAGGNIQAATQYEGLIETNLESELFQQNSSVYLRIPFDVAEPNTITSLSLAMNYDDGFVAYLNGVKIAERNAPPVPLFNSSATGVHEAGEATAPEVIDVSAWLGSLVAGENVLAIHGLNQTSLSDNFLIQPQLTAERILPDAFVYFATPTPGVENIEGALGTVADTTFSVDRGFFEDPFSVQIATETDAAQIRYTLDGSLPTSTTGTVYTGPITVSTTTILRAAAFKPGFLATNVDTQTYLFLEDVLQQEGSGLPSYADWGHNRADWEVDPDITQNAIGDNRLTTSDLKSIPTISLSLPWEDMFGSGGQGIYISGSGSPRGTSVEMISEDGSSAFQIDASVQIQGGTSTNRWKTDKLSMRLKFKEAYGPTKLDFPLFGENATDRFDTFVLDAALNYGWTHPSTGQTNLAKFIEDQYVANLQLAMGGYAPHNQFVHLYINGIYWGMYNAHERPDESFAADYLGGNKEDYDIIKHVNGNVVNGTNANYQALLDLASQDLSNDTEYQNLAAQLDIPDFIDYMLVNFYTGNTDWAHHNWYASFNRVDSNGQWRFHSWDAEHTLRSLTDDVTDKDDAGSPTSIHQSLIANAEYRSLFADHVQKHFFQEGVLTPESAAVEYQNLMDQIDRAVVGESARWGDNRVSSPYTHSDWLNTQIDLLNNYFPARTDIVLAQLQSDNLFPNTDAPLFNQQGGLVASGFELTITAASGTIYYTLDGSDPRQPGGALSGSAVEYTGTPVEISSAVNIRARANNAGEWSALNVASFSIHPAADATNLRISEINYNPYDALPQFGDSNLDNDQFEFIELVNIGPTDTIDLDGVRFSDGIEFTFSADTSLNPGERILVVRNQAAFTSRYGSGFRLAGEFQNGSGLANEGESLQLEDSAGNGLQQFTYNDSGAWPDRASGQGASLEVIDFAGDYSDPGNWQSSNEFGGSPGVEGSGNWFDVVVNEVLSHSDGELLDLVELYNTTSATIELEGWHLSDTSNNYFIYTFGTGTSIGAGQYLVLDEEELGFALNGQQGDDIWLLQGDPTDSGKLLRFADSHHFDATETNVSLGRVPNGDPTAQGASFFPLTKQTFGTQNSRFVVGDVIISEFLFDPAPVPTSEIGNISEGELEYVELYNNTASSLELSGWKLNLRGGSDLTFGANTLISTAEPLLVVRFDPLAEPSKATAFRNIYGLTVDALLAGPFGGSLDNSGEPIELLRPEDPSAPATTGFLLVDRVHYDDASPWPSLGSNLGNSLHRTTTTSLGNFAASWHAATASPGYAEYASINPGDFEPDGDIDGDDLLLWETHFGNVSSVGILPGDADLDGDVDGADFLAWQRYFNGVFEIVAEQSFSQVYSSLEQIALPPQLSATLSPPSNAKTPEELPPLDLAKQFAFNPRRATNNRSSLLDQAFSDTDFLSALDSKRANHSLEIERTFPSLSAWASSQHETVENELDAILESYSLTELLESNFRLVFIKS